jgi:hypothetical protein
VICFYNPLFQGTSNKDEKTKRVPNHDVSSIMTSGAASAIPTAREALMQKSGSLSAVTGGRFALVALNTPIVGGLCIVIVRSALNNNHLVILDFVNNAICCVNAPAPVSRVILFS